MEVKRPLLLGLCPDCHGKTINTDEVFCEEAQCGALLVMTPDGPFWVLHQPITKSIFEAIIRGAQKREPFSGTHD